MTVYADMLFLVNFIMNGFVLWVLSKLTRRKRKLRWLLAGSGAMSLLYTLLIIAEPFRFANVALMSVVILAVGVGVAFYLPIRREQSEQPLTQRITQKALAFLKFMAVAYGISFTVGGLGMALFFLTDLPYAVYYIASDWDGFSRTISWQLALTGAVLSYIMIKIALRVIERQKMKRQMLCSVHVFMEGQDCSFDALVDTGHSLKEPISQSPVIIVEFELMKAFLPDGLKVLFYENQENDLSGLLINREGAFYSRIRMIPFTSVGRANGMLIGFRPDKVTVEGAVTPEADVVIGIYNDRLCRDGRYRGLLSPELVA